MFRAVSIADYYAGTYAPRKLLGKSRSCRTKYERHIRWLSELLGREAAMLDLTEENITALMQARLDRGRSPGTVNSLRSQLVALANYAALRGHIGEGPDVARLQEYKRTPTAWTRQQLRALFQACRAQVGMIGPVLSRDWWTALHCVLWDTGLRIGVLLQATPDDVEGRRLIVRAEDQKQKADQSFMLHADTVAMLEHTDYRKRKRIFPWLKHETMLWYDYKKILASAGLPATRRDMFHRMRRSVASWFEAAGGDATKLLGHSSRKVTLAYLDESIAGGQQASDLLFRP